MLPKFHKLTNIQIFDLMFVPNAVNYKIILQEQLIVLFVSTY